MILFFWGNRIIRMEWLEPLIFYEIKYLKKEGRKMEEIKQRMTNYWSQRAVDFSALRMKEFSGKMHERWIAEFRKYIPMEKPLKILDLGTGTGFFALLLGAEGHQVTGIDLTEDMILQARKSAEILEIPADFYVMDAEAPEFAPETFDVLVTRNLTWGLPHLPEAYRNWHELLKPGGVLVNFDADYCREKKADALPENHAHKGIAPELSKEYEHFKDTLRPGQQPRPQWDVQLLTQAGFHDVTVDTGVWQRIYQEYDEFYNPTPIFTIAAHSWCGTSN